MLRPPSTDPDDEPNPMVAIGVLVQAGLVHRRPDAPASYELRYLSARTDETRQPSVISTWIPLERALPESWGVRAGCQIVTAELAAASGIAPSEIDWVLQAHPGVAVREGQRRPCLELRSIGGDASATLQALLDRA